MTTVEIPVLILNLNGRERLLRCLEACSGLDGGEVRARLVCIDNGSVDGSVEAVRVRFPAVEVIRNDSNLGFARAYNEAICATDSEWVGLLNNDTVPDHAWLSEAYAAARRNGAACVGSRLRKDGGARVDFVGSSMNFYGHGFHPHFEEPSTVVGDERPMIFACAGAMLCRRDVFLQAGGFDEDYFAYLEDVDLGWRLNVLGHEVYYAPDSVVDHEHGGTTSEIVPPYQRLTWIERNGLRGLIKNYDDRRLARVLPVALALCVKRAQLDSSIDPETFFFERGGAEPGARAGSRYEGPPAPRRSGSRLDRARAIVRERGLVDGALYMAYRLLGLRFENAGLSAEFRKMHQNGFARIAAMESVISQSPSLCRSRAEIQRARRRSDESVTELFIDCFRPSFPHPDLKVLQDELVAAFCLAELFP